MNNRSSSRDRGQFRDRHRFEQNYRGNNFQNNARGYGRQNSRGNIEMVVIDVVVMIEVGIDQERGHSQEFIVAIELEVQAVVGLGQDPEPVLIGTE